MAPPEGQDARRGIANSGRSRPVDPDNEEIGRLATLMIRIRRARARFRQIAKSDGVGAAMARAAAKVRKKLIGHAQRLILGIGPDHCRYFTPARPMDPYDAWRGMNRDNPRRRRRLEASMRPDGPGPRFSILVPTYQPAVDVFAAMIESVVDQTYASWELILVANGCNDPELPRLMDEWSRRDVRIRALHRPVNGNISAATNQAAAAARGEYLVLLDSDDLLVPDALAHLAVHLDAHPDTDIVYSDEDQVGADNRPHSPQFKPGWSPELLLSFCYLGHLAAIRRSLYEDVGGMRSAFDGSQDHDLWLRAAERTDRVGHVPQILYHWRIVAGSGAAHWKPATFEAGRLAVEAAFHRRGLDCSVRQIDWAAKAGCAIFEPIMPDDGPSVAILIPTRNQWQRLKLAIDSLSKTTYRNYRITILDNESDDPATLAYLAATPHRVLRIPNRDGRFSFAAINNAAAARVDEDLLLFLNDDTEVINPRWLSQMVGWSRLEGVGAVGARLLYPDRRVQHAGVIGGVPEGLAGHAFRYSAWWDQGQLNLARVSRNCVAVTAACMLTPRRLFLEHGGFDETRFAVAYNDLDYSYRLGDAGFRCVYCAEAELTHHEGLSRGSSGDPREMAAYREVHGHRVDPYFSPHLDPESEAFQVRPTVVPVGHRAEPVPLLAMTHNLNWEGAPRIEFEIVRRLHASGAVRAEVISPLEGPLRRAYEELGIPIRIEPALADLRGPGCGIGLYRETTARLAEQIAAGGYEVVHANTLVSFPAIEAARLAGIPSVWSVHESEPWQTYFSDMQPEVAASALACLSYPYRVVFSAISTMRVWQALDTSRNFGLIRYAHDVPLIRREMEKVDRTRARRELALEDQDICVLLLGTVCERKGQHDLLRAFAALPASAAARIKCIVVGARETEPYSRELVAMAAKLPADRRDRFVIIPETGETSAFWQAADVFCCTSRIECYPLVIMEAMAAGLPIVTTPVYGIAEQVQPSVNALTYPPRKIATLARHLALLVEDEALRHAMAGRSPQVLGSLSDAARMNELYRRTILAAAESSPLFPANPVEGRAGQPAEARGRVWFADPARRGGPARSGSREGTRAAR
jgi:GT2 family glycosyltransferase/glycosyltransferase involved in cell wall biosynthesis